MVTEFDWLLQIKHRLTYVGDEFAWGFQSNQGFLISVLKNHRLAKILRRLLIQFYYWVRGRDRRKLRQEGGVCNDHPLRVHSVNSNRTIDDDDIWLQLPEFMSVFLCYLNCRSRWGLKNNSLNLYKETTNSRILVVVVKWRHLATVLFRMLPLECFLFKSNDPQLHATVHWIKHRVTFVGVQLVRCPTALFIFLEGKALSDWRIPN